MIPGDFVMNITADDNRLVRDIALNAKNNREDISFDAKFRKEKKSLTVELKKKGDRLPIYRYLYSPRPDFIEIAPVLDDKISVCETFPVSLGFQMSHSFSSHLLLKKPLKIIIDLPTEVEITKLNVRSASTVSTIQKLPEQIRRNGGEYNRYVIRDDCLYNDKLAHYIVSLRSNVKSGSSVLYYYAEWDEGRQPEQSFPLAYVSLPKCRAPKKFITGIYAFYPAEIELNLQDDWARILKDEIGINTISIPDDKEMGFISMAQDEGYYLRLGDYFFPAKKGILQNQVWAWALDDPAARAKDIYGNNVAVKKNYHICPSYRGAEFQSSIRRVGKIMASTGISWCAFDLEAYMIRCGPSVCFCDNCLRLFKEDFKKNHSGLAYIEPKVFEKTPEAYPQYHKIWVEFKCDTWAGMFKDMRNMLKDYTSGQSCPWPGCVFSEYSLNPLRDDDFSDIEVRNKTLHDVSWFKTFDIFEFGAYSSVGRMLGDMRKVNPQLAQMGAFPKQMFTLSPRRWKDSFFKSDDITLAEEFKYKMFEGAAAGCKGAYIWYYRFIDAETLKQWCEAINVISKVEDIILDGVELKNLSSAADKTNIKGLKLGNKSIVLVSEYLTRDPIKTEIRLPISGKSASVSDLETGEAREINGANPVFSADLTPSRRAIMFLVEEK